MGLFSGLEAFGFHNDDMEIYEKEKPKEKTDDGATTGEATVSEEDCLFQKTHKCPICDHEFKSSAVRAGKLRSVGQDDDLRPIYKSVDPLKYDAIVCPACGYSALSRYFNHVMPLQSKRIRAQVTPNFKGMQLSNTVFSYDEAITHYKMVLMCDVVGGVKNSRKAYTCLKLAWILRGKIEQDGDAMDEQEKAEFCKEELECVENAYEGFRMAFSSEGFPMCGMDEITMSYLIAELAFELGKYRESLKMLSGILGNNSVPSRLKEKAVDLKEKIRASVMAEKDN